MNDTKDLPNEALLETVEKSSDAADKGTKVSKIYGKAEKLLDGYNHCQLCGSNLHFTHVTDFNRNLTQETARCPECGVKARQLQHKLQ